MGDAETDLIRHRATDAGSLVRDHLANERTYLAWLRTSATVMLLGLALAKFVEPDDDRTVIAGALLVAVGAAGLVQGSVRYRRVSLDLAAGRVRADGSWRAPLVAGAVLLVAVAITTVLLAV